MVSSAAAKEPFRRSSSGREKEERGLTVAGVPVRPEDKRFQPNLLSYNDSEGTNLIHIAVISPCRRKTNLISNASPSPSLFLRACTHSDHERQLLVAPLDSRVCQPKNKLSASPTTLTSRVQLQSHPAWKSPRSQTASPDPYLSSSLRHSPPAPPPLPK